MTVNLSLLTSLDVHIGIISSDRAASIYIILHALDSTLEMEILLPASPQRIISLVASNELGDRIWYWKILR